MLAGMPGGLPDACIVCHNMGREWREVEVPLRVRPYFGQESLSLQKLLTSTFGRNIVGINSNTYDYLGALTATLVPFLQKTNDYQELRFCVCLVG